MVESERRREALMVALAELIGEETTATLMQALPPFDWSALATRDDIARLDTRIDGLERRFDGLEQRFGQLEVRFGGLEHRFGQLEDRFGQLEGRLGGLEDRFGQLEGRLGGLEDRFSGLEGRLGGLEDRFSGLEHRMEGVETTLFGAFREHEAVTDARLESLGHQVRSDLHEALGKHTRALGFFTGSTVLGAVALVLGTQGF